MLGKRHFIPRRTLTYLGVVSATVSLCFYSLFSFSHVTSQEILPLTGISWTKNQEQTVAPKIVDDGHPIGSLMREANDRWHEYEDNRSKNFRDTVRKYRQTHGRHPPPGFKEWYQFARRNKAHNVDDFQQISGDLRPFWAIAPSEIRRMALNLQEGDGIAGIRVREGKVVSKPEGWRAETLSASIERLAKYLPDMDIAMNTLDQPRIMAPHEDMQTYLRLEETARSLPTYAVDRFTSGMNRFYNGSIGDGDRFDPAWFSVAGEPYMKYAKDACSPESPANTEMSTEEADALYKEPFGGFVSNFTGSSDLCTVGPALGDKHGFLFSASSNVITRKLLPVFSECKVSVNNDIVFPANMYFRNDPRYTYKEQHDKDWEHKSDTVLWRGVTSGGIQLEDNWQRLHRQRFVRLANSTEMENQTVSILSKDTENQYRAVSDYNPFDFALSHFDVGFTDAWGCIPDCSFYSGVWTYKENLEFPEQFKSKYLVDIDGHSFSGRWRAFHQSKSLGLKATIFREWHDSRLFAWRHFVPMDNQFTDLYSLMTYFLGVGSSAPGQGHINENAYDVPRHDLEAQVIASQSRNWAQKVLRDQDLDIYLYLLLLEYGRIIDDNRDHIGYSGDGGELDEFDAHQGSVGG
ncbi:Lipopolysaccharide-modifying protein [Penicillium capsulatum]|uniref:Lipopolysaccharide-modifying protein n=1 Tax=Penicillium capsulatum TaxID=69766 RepID=A0A9W9IK87_9EURO|nr:Lipopolysaccharide-modifying protein [Penicillium capsulatum]KAJ6121565.1 Lipopolysaccharide-modifying protein [Penicillium capsulatum]